MPSEKEIRAAFAVFDADKSGALSVDELCTVLTRPGTGVTPLSVEEIQALIDEFDADAVRRAWAHPELGQQQQSGQRGRLE